MLQWCSTRRRTPATSRPFRAVIVVVGLLAAIRLVVG
jgi:hypothetical protein